MLVFEYFFNAMLLPSPTRGDGDCGEVDREGDHQGRGKGLGNQGTVWGYKLYEIGEFYLLRNMTAATRAR